MKKLLVLSTLFLISCAGNENGSRKEQNLNDHVDPKIEEPQEEQNLNCGSIKDKVLSLSGQKESDFKYHFVLLSLEEFCSPALLAKYLDSELVISCSEHCEIREKGKK